MNNNNTVKKLKVVNNKNANKKFLRISIFISILIIIGPLVGFIIVCFNKIDFEHNPFNKQVITFSEDINKKIFIKNEHEFTVSSVKGRQNYLNKKQVAQAVNNFNTRTLEENLKMFVPTEQTELIQKLELSKSKDKYFYKEQEIKKIQLLPIKFRNSNSAFNDIYGVVDLENSNNIKYNIYYKYLYQVVIYEINNDKPIILKKRLLFKYDDLNVSTEQLLKKSNILTSSSNIDSFIFNYFISNYNYNTYGGISSNLVNDFIINYDSKKINRIEQLDAFELKKNASLYIKINNLKINFTKNKINFNVRDLPPYIGQKESEMFDPPPQFWGSLQLILNEHSITITIKFEPNKIIIPDPKKDDIKNFNYRED